MMVTLISQCEKNAIKKTNRVLDAFANRIGDRTWQTAITQEGLNAVKQMLRKTASKNTAISCHWIRSNKRSDLLWTIGRKNYFTNSGVVPVNYTKKDMSQFADKNKWQTLPVIQYAAAIAGLFHDFGKANALFQDKLNPNKKNTKIFEPYRHEWVSLRLFQAFVNKQKDKVWLNNLLQISNSTEEQVLKKITSLKDGLANNINQPFEVLPPFGKLVAWLIVSHHRLPIWPKNIESPPNLSGLKKWRETIFEPCWNSPQCLNDDWGKSIINQNWDFPNGTPFISALWQNHASELAKKILKNENILNHNWLDQSFTAHLARLSLMLADHYYSSNKPDIKVTTKWQDRNYNAYANTYKNKQGEKKYKQKLDEHNIAVGTYAAKIARMLPNLHNDLPTLKDNKKLEKQTNNNDFKWQNHAYNLSKSIQKETKKYGFFGICKASTGKGKTLANARIMCGLSENGQCRFNIALGLRTLTMQTAKALEKDLDLHKDDFSMLIGSQTVKELHGDSQFNTSSEQEVDGSESSEPLLKDATEIFASSTDYYCDFNKWIAHDPKILKLIQSPILISTIDYLMPANESLRGGRQIAPMLRLLTSDLILDEPDDFSLEDLPALCRLVHWSGMLGGKILLSTATMPPALAEALFEAYQAGRKQYTEVNDEEGVIDTVYCAWFDEFEKPIAKKIKNKESFKTTHYSFVKTRINNLNKYNSSLSKAELVDIHTNKEKKMPPSKWLAHSIRKSILTLHDRHAINIQNKQISIGLVRMANINPLAQVSKYLLQNPPPEDTIIHYCIYHGQFPLIQRSAIEQQLDKALTRKKENMWLKNSGISEKISGYTEKKHIFVVIATSVAEVGRDHDYDWAIVEPSSIRSIIQLAGRIQRHRKKEPDSKNIHIFSTNYKGLQGLKPNFNQPGFETNYIQYASRTLNENDILPKNGVITAIPRIEQPEKFSFTNSTPKKAVSFNALEHISQRAKLFGSKNEKNYASQWWLNDTNWCGEIQRRQPFRESFPDKDYCLFQAVDAQNLIWHEKTPKTYPQKYQKTDDISKKEEIVDKFKGNVFWVNIDLMTEINRLTQKPTNNRKQLIQTFTHITLRELNKDSAEQWLWHKHLGIYKTLKKDRWNNDG